MPVGQAAAFAGVLCGSLLVASVAASLALQHSSLEALGIDTSSRLLVDYSVDESRPRLAPLGLAVVAAARHDADVEPASGAAPSTPAGRSIPMANAKPSPFEPLPSPSPSPEGNAAATPTPAVAASPRPDRRADDPFGATSTPGAQPPDDPTPTKTPRPSATSTKPAPTTTPPSATPTPDPTKPAPTATPPAATPTPEPTKTQPPPTPVKTVDPLDPVDTPTPTPRPTAPPVPTPPKGSSGQGQGAQLLAAAPGGLMDPLADLLAVTAGVLAGSP